MPASSRRATSRAARPGDLLHSAHNALGTRQHELLCVKAPTQRIPAQNTGGDVNDCDGVLAVNWNEYQVTHPTSIGNPWMVGMNAQAQVVPRPAGAQDHEPDQRRGDPLP